MGLKEDIYFFCRLYVNRFVRLHTRQGHLVEGTIVHVDSEHVYVRLSEGDHEQARGYFPPPPPPPPRLGPYPHPPGPGHYPPAPVPYGPNNQIMTLALFDLLAITLLLL